MEKAINKPSEKKAAYLFVILGSDPAGSIFDISCAADRQIGIYRLQHH